jgi:hypothetical protein
MLKEIFSNLKPMTTPLWEGNPREAARRAGKWFLFYSAAAAVGATVVLAAALIAGRLEPGYGPAPAPPSPITHPSPQK